MDTEGWKWHSQLLLSVFHPQNHNFWLPKAGAALQEHTDEQLWQPANAATNNPGQAKAKKTTLSTR